MWGKKQPRGFVDQCPLGGTGTVFRPGVTLGLVFTRDEWE